MFRTWIVLVVVDVIFGLVALGLAFIAPLWAVSMAMLSSSAFCMAYIAWRNRPER